MDAEFLEALLHDLQGPLSRVRLLGELLARRTAGLDEDSQRLLGHIGASATAAERVLEAVRRYTAAVALPFRAQQFDLAVAVAIAVARLDAQLASSGAQVNHGPLPQLFGDPVQMAALLEELISNSMRFRSAESPRIEIRAAPDESRAEWLISVVDNGIGLDGLELERLFRPLVVFPGRPRPAIGLAICRRIARQHGGDIAAVPRPQGAEFHLRLPQVDSSATLALREL
jgi:signal transduction histidine kinase